ncbi:MAG: hypothetical protein WDN48_09480 [Pseudolabrys sp.]
MPGLGGVGLSGAGLTIINAGTIAGGMAGDGLTRAYGIVFTGGANFLANTGTITGGVNVQGGSFAPALAASPIGTALNIGNGPLTFASGTSYNIRLSPNANDSVITASAATLTGATVNAAFSPGAYVARQYTILSAVTLGGTTFAGLNSNTPANFTSSLSYGASDVFLDLVLNFTPGPDFGGSLNGNQQNVANALVTYFNTTGGIPAAFSSLSPSGLTRVSGEAASGSTQASFDLMNMFLGVLSDPFIAGRGSEGGVSAFTRDDEALGYAGARKRSGAERDAQIAVTPRDRLAALDRRWSVWASGYGGSSTVDGSAAAGSNSTTSRVYGTAIGADYRVSPNTLIGFCAGRRRLQLRCSERIGRRPRGCISGRRVRAA